MGSGFGSFLKVSVFGQSHGAGIGVLLDGLPPGEKIDMEELYRFMRRRAPGGTLATPRMEADEPYIISGLTSKRTNGAPLCAVIENTNTRSQDYKGYEHVPRPGHADYTGGIRYYGYNDIRGGGHFSGRLTAPLCAAGGIALQILRRRGIDVAAHVYSVGDVRDYPIDPVKPDMERLHEAGEKSLCTLSGGAGERMIQLIKTAREDGDSIGGVIECAVTGLEAGLGSPMFGGVENRLACALFGIPAVKGVEFGGGFALSGMRGSMSNDPFILENGNIKTETNNCGGILGGITDGMPVIFKIAVKPTPSITKRQESVDTQYMQQTSISVEGRHDPCVAVRAVPVVESIAALVALDLLLERHGTPAGKKVRFRGRFARYE